MPEDLLDHLAVQVGCEILSELRRPEYRKRLLELLLQLQPEEYPASQWRETLLYLLYL